LNLIDSKDRTVLILSHFWTPINITTAKEGVRKLISSGSSSHKNPSVKALSFSGEPLLWEDWIDSSRASYYKSQPFLSSSNALYPVPTILLTTAKWVYQTKNKPNLRYLYKRYKGRCQICGDKFDMKDMTIEHIYPKSKGGTKESYNVTLTCQTCNCKKAAIYPYTNKEGKELKPANPYPFFHPFQREREEWKPFLFRS
jgi:5-methylcytosine-specific restriction endonuclease McrA